MIPQLLIILLLLISSTAGIASDLSDPAWKPKYDKLESVLSEYLEIRDTQSQAAADQFAKLRRLIIQNDKIWVEFDFYPDKYPADINPQILSRFNVTIASQSRNFMDAWVPVNNLPELALALEPVSIIHTPRILKPNVVTEGVERIHADACHLQRMTGQDISVAVIDLGFRDANTAVDRNELPDFTSRNYTGEQFDQGSKHGTACAEIVYDVAPGIDLHLLKIFTSANFENAMEYVTDNRLQVVSMSLSEWIPVGDYYRGADRMSSIVTDAFERGVFFVCSAGNYAKTHYRANFDDDNNNDRFHRFADNVTVNHFGSSPNNFTNISAGGYLDVALVWDDFPGTDQDFDLEIVKRDDNNEWQLYARSANRQDGNDAPYEYIQAEADERAVYGVRVIRSNAANGMDFTLFSYQNLSRPVEEGSLTLPAVCPESFCVGAIDERNWYNEEPAIQSYSSQGPTYDNRIKPELCAPDAVATWAQGVNFRGTSASCPHAAGAAAVWMSGYRELNDNSDMFDYLKRYADDIGDEGDDPVFGAGKLNIYPSIPILRQFTEFIPAEQAHSMLITELLIDENEPAPDGWEVGVFNPNENLCGGGIWRENEVGFNAWGGEDQFQHNDEFHFRVWDPVENEEYPCDMTIFEGPERWVNNGVTNIHLSATVNPHHAVLITEVRLNGEPVRDGVWVGIFKNNEIESGSGQWHIDDSLGISATGAENEFEPGDQLFFRLFDPFDEIEYYAEPEFIDGPERWTLNGFTTLTLNGITQPHHVLLVEGVTVNNQPLSEGWEIRVFNNDDDLCGSTVIDRPEQEEGFLAFGGEDLFAEDDQFFFKLFDPENRTEHAARPEFTAGPELWGNGGFTKLNLTSIIENPNEWLLFTGWNMISVNISPDLDTYDRNDNRKPDIRAMMEPIIDNLTIIKDERGNFYAPRWNYDGIGDWSITEGYMIKVTADLSVSWDGEPIPFDAPIPLTRGWNIMAYFPTFESSAEAPDFPVLANIIDHVIIAKDMSGNFIAPAREFSNMLPWRPHQGYLIKVDQDILFSYSDEPRLNGGQLHEPDNSRKTGRHSTTENSTGHNMSLLIHSITGPDFTLGDRIVAANFSGSFYSQGIIQADGQCGLVLWGDDPTTEAIDGFREGEEILLSLVSGSGNHFEITAGRVLSGKGLVYGTDELSVIDVNISPIMPVNFEVSAFPNPFNSATTVKVSLPEDSRLKVAIYDLNGRLLKELNDDLETAGNLTFPIAANDFPAGLYMLKALTHNQLITRKIIILK